MGDDTLSEGTLQILERMRAKGVRIHGPGPMTPGATTPTKNDAQALPGMHVQMIHGSRMVDGFGVTAEDAVRDALMKLEGS